MSAVDRAGEAPLVVGAGWGKLRYKGGMALEISTCTQQDYNDTSALHHPMLVNEFGNSAFVIRAGLKVIAYLMHDELRPSLLMLQLLRPASTVHPGRHFVS